MIPMGTIMAACLVVGGVVLAVARRLPHRLVMIVGVALLAAGLWNAGWHGLRHFQQFWGQMAFWSGLVLLASGTVCISQSFVKSEESYAHKALPILAVLLLGFGTFYSWTIYNL